MDELLGCVRELRCWFEAWYGESWNDNESGGYVEMIDVKRILLRIEEAVLQRYAEEKG